VIAAMTAGALRRAQRRLHLLAGAVLFAYVYAPLGAELEEVVRFAVLPVLALTGIAMWQAARIRRGLRSLRSGRHRSIKQPNRNGRYRHATSRDG
jgi:hypothetical protein